METSRTIAVLNSNIQNYDITICRENTKDFNTL